MSARCLLNHKLGLIIQHAVLWKNWITAFKIKVTAKVQNVSKCLSGWYLLNHRTFCYQTWYGDPAWARVSHRIFFWHLLSSRSRSQWGLIWSKYDSFYYIFWTVDSLATKLGLMIRHHDISKSVLWKKIGLLISGSRSQWRVKRLMFCPDDIFYSTKRFVSKLGIVMHHFESGCHAKRLICYI